MKKRLVIMLLGWFAVSQSQQKEDTLKAWMNKFSMPVSLKVTENGKYATVIKSYKGNRDTLLVFSNGNQKPGDTIIGSVSAAFLGNRYVWATGKSKTVLLDMQSRKKSVVENVKKSDALVMIGQYYTLSREGTLRVYDLKGNIRYEVQGVKDAVSDQRNRIFWITHAGGQQELWKWDGKKGSLKYSSPGIIAKLEILPSQKYMVIYEGEKHAALKSLKLMDTEKGMVLQTEGLHSVKTAGWKVMEIGKGEAVLVMAEDSVPVQENRMLEIWYGADQELRSEKYGNKSYRYWLWSLKNGDCTVLPDNKFKMFTALGNARYLWAFNITEQFRYIHSNPVYNFSAWDIQNNSAALVFEQAQEVTGSADGRYAVAYSHKSNQWQLYDMASQQIEAIEGEDLRQPVFTKDGKSLWFSGKTDLWSLNLQTKKLQPLNVSPNHEVRVLGTDLTNRFTTYTAGFGIRTIDTGQAVVAEINDREKILSSWVTLKKGKIKVLIPWTANKVKELWYREGVEKMYTLEENYNLPRGIWLGKIAESSENSKKLMYQTNGHDKKGHRLKQDIISFKNTKGIPLKALLAYPVNFDPRKKYPVIVRIYQKQIQYAGDYITPELSDDGFSKRICLEEGYFVYQPDIVFDERGTGIAALDCVNAAMEAIADHPNIEQSKIGLTGHSLGGYETNFIATQSDRFAAYISGAGVSNILQAYFSFSTLFKVANYARFENGQFEINIPFKENKELYRKNDPVSDVENVSAPMLLWAGQKDTNIPPEQTMAFYMGLLRNKKPVVELLYKNQAHALGKDTEETKDLNRRTIEWWNYFLKDQRNMEWIDKEMKKGAW